MPMSLIMSNGNVLGFLKLNMKFHVNEHLLICYSWYIMQNFKVRIYLYIIISGVAYRFPLILFPLKNVLFILFIYENYKKLSLIFTYHLPSFHNHGYASVYYTLDILCYSCLILTIYLKFK